MCQDEQLDPQQLLMQAKMGDADSLGALMESYRNYLNLLARTQIDLHLKRRVDASDIVQETMLDACRDFRTFRGQSEAELLTWLRSIFVCNMGRLVQKHFVAQKRDARRDRSLDDRLAMLDRSSAKVEEALVGQLSSPSAPMRRQERAAVLADHMASLPQNYREVIVLRNLEGLSFDEVARCMQRTPGAVRVLWVRAIDHLRKLLQGENLL